MVATCSDDTRACARDRALLLDFAGGFRRSELVVLDVADLEETTDGLRIRIARSKTDQEGAGDEKGIPFDQHPEPRPIRALRARREVAGIIDGALFRRVNRHDQVQEGRLSDRGVALIVKRAAAAAGAGHSFRRMPRRTWACDKQKHA